MSSEKFSVSVIIPVYNAGRFVRRAIESALGLAETGEIILVEDGSLDDSLSACEQLAAEHPNKIKLLRHHDGVNCGAGISRNLGIHHARYEFIAFLDADDYYLPNRFTKDKALFENDDSIDGVYDAHGIDLTGEGSRWWTEKGGYTGLISMPECIKPESLLIEMAPIGLRGAFLTNAIVVRKRIFTKTACMFTNRQFGEDTLLWMQMAAVGKLVGGELKKPVAMRGVHVGNRIQHIADSRKSTLSVIDDFEQWIINRGISNRDLSDAMQYAGMRLSRCLRELSSHVLRNPRCVLRITTWRVCFVWMFIRQFPEDPLVPGFFPSWRRARRARLLEAKNK